MAEPVTLTNATLQKMRSALAILGNRRMANLGADLKVARLLRFLSPLVEPLEAVKRTAALAIIDQLPEGAVLTPTQEQIIGIRIAAEQAKVDALTVEVELPMVYALKEIDLPKELAGADGARNNSQLGALISDLGPLYLIDGDG